VDPDGEEIETVPDLISFGLSVVDFVRDPSWENAGFAVLDLVSVAAVGVPAAAGYVRHAGKLDDAAKAVGW
jgi:hypothetical protein